MYGSKKIVRIELKIYHEKHIYFINQCDEVTVLKY